MYIYVYKGKKYVRRLTFGEEEKGKTFAAIYNFRMQFHIQFVVVIKFANCIIID